MAYDEVLEHQAQLRFRAEFPTFVSIRIIVQTNPRNVPDYSENFVRDVQLTETNGSLGSWVTDPRWGFCANPRCVGAQIDLTDLCRRRLGSEGGAIEFAEEIACRGYEHRRRKTIRERITSIASTGWWDDARFVIERGLPDVRCKNVLGISGSILFNDGSA